ncbi:L-aspartate oxidase [Litorihabitans aurantiacus]|uniref:L-aspartate oxidase n=1 Tax=Litorihabitans aurantiacus TaxID=1930061 RepID=A0AA37XFE9_9MICO|nr:L-aspartate oxidase [Litorihabitans aurantiacus]GMA32017.1 L-aspartate oxidase [Litorihabitans aurantiacus]
MSLVVVGSGLAGLLVALEAEASGTAVVLVAKGALTESNTAWAQGGVAVVGPRPDTVVSHVSDTRRAGGALSDPAAAMALAADGPDAVARLVDLGVTFDSVEGEPCRALEAAHSHARVLRAGGDATGAEIVRALAAAVRERGISVREHTHAIDVVLESGEVTGLLVRTPEGDVERIPARDVVLATGGAGQLFATTTNPTVATADGVAIALRAGAEVADLEMVQFHPTVLAGPRPFLVSEAVRGEGAVLLDDAGRRFMTDVHPDAELAPRDVVARAIAAQEARQGSPVLLDATHLGADVVARRFPTIAAACAQRGYDLTAQPVPVTPAAHYWMGGVRTDLAGRTSVPGLWAAGEVACTGVHGANRLASNSLLEAAVFARRVVAALAADGDDGDGVPRVHRAATAASVAAWDAPVAVDLADGPGAADWDRDSLQRVMSDYAGLARDAAGLARAAHVLAGFRTPPLLPDAMVGLEARDVEDANLLLAARALVAAAAARTGSLGAHTRSDAPAPGADLGSRERHHVLVAAGGVGGTAWDLAPGASGASELV